MEKETSGVMEADVEKILRGGRFLALLDRQGDRIRKEYGLKKADIGILYYLYRNPEHNTARDIQDYFNMNKGHISQTVAALGKKGYLTAAEDQVDRRYVHYTVTEKADRLGKDLIEMWEHINEKVFEGISEEERTTFRRVAARIEQNISKVLKQ